MGLGRDPQRLAPQSDPPAAAHPVARCEAFQPLTAF